MDDFTVDPITSPDQFQEWDALVEKSPNGTVFHHSWWLENTGKDFAILGARDGEGRLRGGIPLTYARRFGLRLVRNPALTPYLGPVIDCEPDPTSYGSVSLTRKVGAALGEAMRDIDDFSQHIGPQAPDLQGFLWNGFTAELRYTFVIDAGKHPDEVSSRMHVKHRAELLKAARRGVRVTESEDVDLFFALNQMTFERNGLRVPYERSLLRSLWDIARWRGHALLLLATNAAGTATDGAIFFTDSRRFYLVLAGGDPKHRGDGGGNAVIWEGIQRALRSGQAFDFEGSAIPSVESFYRRWGGVPSPTVYLQKTFTRRAYVAGVVKNCLRRA